MALSREATSAVSAQGTHQLRLKRTRRQFCRWNRFTFRHIEETTPGGIQVPRANAHVFTQVTKRQIPHLSFRTQTSRSTSRFGHCSVS